MEATHRTVPGDPTIALTIPLADHDADPSLGARVVRVVDRRHFAVLGTTSAEGRPHAAGVLYQRTGSALWVSTLRSSRKARNVAAAGRVAVTIPVRRIPLGPPSSVQVQARATVLDLDDPELRERAGSGALDKVTGHGELELQDGCFLRIELPRRVPVYGLGMSLWRLIREPLAAGRIAEVIWT